MYISLKWLEICIQLNNNCLFNHFRNFGCNGTDTILMMELLGPSLKDLLTVCGGKMSIKTVHMLVCQ